MPTGTVQLTMVCIWTLQIELDNGHDDDSCGGNSYQDSKEGDKCFSRERHDESAILKRKFARNRKDSTIIEAPAEHRGVLLEFCVVLMMLSIAA